MGMSTKNYNSKKTYTNSKRNYYPKKTTNQYLTKKEYYAKERSKADLKYVDVTGLSQNMTSSGTLTSIFTNLTRGDNGLNNFNGNTFQPKGVLLNYCVQTNQTYNYCRVMLVQWKDSAAPALSGILQYTTTGTATVSPTLVTNKSLMKVLYDKTFTVAPTASGDATVLGYGTFCDKVYIPQFKLGKVRFNSTTNVQQDNDIYIVYLSDDSLSTYPQITFTVRTSFYDD